MIGSRWVMSSDENLGADVKFRNRNKGQESRCGSEFEIGAKSHDRGEE